jgi:hypothetical protein
MHDPSIAPFKKPEGDGTDKIKIDPNKLIEKKDAKIPETKTVIKDDAKINNIARESFTSPNIIKYNESCSNR